MRNKKTFIELPEVYDGLDWMNINMSQEDYDTIYDGPRPNGSSKSWYLKETGKLQAPLNMGVWNFFSEYESWFPNDKLLNQHQPHILDKQHCHFKYKEELKGERHLYVITVYNPNYFKLNREIGFSVVDKQYQNDVRSGRAYIIILYPWEGYPGTKDYNDFEIVEEWRKKALFPSGSVHFITGNLNAPNHPTVKEGGIIAHPICTFDNWNSHLCDEPIVDFKPSDEKYLFVSYNRNPRYPRVYLANKLIEHELIDKGLVSLQRPDWWKSVNIMRQDGIRDYAWDKLNRMLPLEIGKKLTFNLACNIELTDFEKTFCSLVTETLVENGTLFLSEKIWKPIQTGHPFFVLGNPGTLNYLRNNGYRTFSEWWDESYDHVDDYRIRTEMITQEIKKLSNYSIDDLKTIRKEMNEVILHNKTLHYNALVQKWGFNMSEKPLVYLELFDKLYKQLQDGKDLL